MRRFLTGLLAAALCACAAPQRVDRLEPPAVRDRPSAEAAGVHADLVRTMLAQGQYYAALAHIEELRNQHGSSDLLDVLQAEALRELGRTGEAEQLYQQLLQTGYAGEANHGLGLIYSQRNPAYGLRFLAEAVRREPTDVLMRNDYGFALMQAGHHEQALAQLATAMELAPGSERARNNLLILLMLTGDEAGVRRVAAAGGLDNAELAVLRQQAARMRAARTTASVRP